jgi:hypothetical protein
MSLYQKRRCRRNGFTLVGILLALLVSNAVTGSVAMLLRYGLLPAASNGTCTAAQRGALSLVELRSKEISPAGQVKIISDEANYKIIRISLKSDVTSSWAAARKCAIFKQPDVGLTLKLKTKEGGDNFKNFVPITVCRSPPA